MATLNNFDANEMKTAPQQHGDHIRSD